MSEDIVQLCPGDVCVFIRTEMGTETNDTLCMFVASPVMHAYGHAAERLVWVQVQHFMQGNTYVRLVAKATVTSLPLWISGSRSCPSFRKRSIPNSGVLYDGTPY